ncbi:MAG: hypothetical protein RLZZ592_1323 [Pseudomonadota bacterium]
MATISGPDSMSGEDGVPRFRTAAVARMTGIAVATLRVWERRYRIVAPPQSPSGHRLYSSADVRRLGMIRALVEQGHAVGTLAGQAEPALQALLVAGAAEPAAPGRVHRAPAAAEAAAVAAARFAPRPLVVCSAGRTLPAVLAAQLGALPGAHRLLDWAAQSQVPMSRGDHDLLALEIDTLHPDLVERLLALQQDRVAREVMVVYGFGPDRLVQQLRAQGVAVWRGPLGRGEMARLLRATLHELTETGTGPQAGLPLPPEVLARVARQTMRVQCECPRHLAELIQMLGDFESYSARCAVDTPADRRLHEDLGQIARQARHPFEQALRRIAAEEGWVLDALQSAPPVIGE